MHAAGNRRQLMRRRGMLLILSVALCLPAFTNAGAQQLSDIPAAFVDVGIGARPMGMGGAVAAANLGPESIFWNPAGLASGAATTSFSVTHGEQMGLVPYSAASAGHTFGPGATLGAGLTVGVGLIRSGDEVLTEMTLLVGAARDVADAPWCADRRIGAGVGLRGRSASFGNNESTDGQVTGSATGFGVDVGALVPLSGTVTLGLSGRDILGSLTWDSSAAGNYSEDVPPALTIGLRAEPHDHLAVEMDVEKSIRMDNPDRVLAGIELSLWGIADLRGGYRRALQSGELEEYTVGAGASVNAASMLLRIDFAYLFGQLENTMRFSLGVTL